MRNREAARYARWAAIAAGTIAFVVIGIYAAREIRAARRRHAMAANVTSAVQQQTHTFSYSGMEGNRTIYTIRASQATQFKEGSQALLEDVWITIYGRQGDRNDDIHTRECSYEQKTGTVHCQGEVSVNLRGSPNSSGPVPQSLKVNTSNLTFDGQTGEASTPAPVEFTLPEGHGRGVGVSYSTRAAIVRVKSSVTFEMAPSDRTANLPVSLTADNLEIRRNDRAVVLNGPVRVQEGDRVLSAGRVSVSLDENFHARHALAEGHPSLQAAQVGGTLAVSADVFEASLNPAGWVERMAAKGDVKASRSTAAGSDRFSCDHVEFALAPTRNVLREMTATGNIAAESHTGGVSQVLKTRALRVKFAPGAQPDQQRIESAETLGPATIDSRSADETTQLRASKFTAQLNENGRLTHLLGGPGVDVQTQPKNSSLQISSADSLNATFDSHGQWSTVEEKGNVHFQQADRRASAAYAKIDRAADRITLTGSPVVSDAMSRTTAGIVTIAQKSGQILAEHGVVSTYLPAKPGASLSLGSGAALISADTLSGFTSSGLVTYSGHARLWQGESIIEADRIVISRDDQKLEALGNVMAAFPQTSGPSLKPASQTKTPASAKSGPTLWQLRGSRLTYWNQDGKALIEGGVQAVSQQGSMQSRTLEVRLSPASAAASANAASSPGRQLSSAIAQGNVIVRQADLRGSADEAEYTAADGKFVLSGGHPTVTDSFGNTTSGRSLTFFVANDTISIDSQEGSRTVTRHRVEK